MIMKVFVIYKVTTSQKMSDVISNEKLIFWRL